MRHIKGSCHCGNITFDFHLPRDEPPIPVRACGCGFCRKHQGLWTSHPRGRLTGRISDHGEVNHYRFGHGTADFYVCRSCGVAPFVVSHVEGDDRAVVNVNCFDNVPTSELSVSDTNFDGESVDERLARRHRNWIGTVTIA